MEKSALRPDRTAEILSQVAPPYAFFAAVLNLQSGRRRRTFEVMSTAIAFGSVAGQQFKHAFRVLRPADRSPLIQPMLATPGHSSYPAGHAAQCHLLKGVLVNLLGIGATSERYGQLDRLADRIADNRIVAGLHYPIDNEQGRFLGTRLAEFFIAQSAVANSPLAWLWKQARNET